MSKQRIEIEVDIPDGYEATGEFRKPRVGETVLVHNGGIPLVYDCSRTVETSIILRRKAPLAIHVCRDLASCIFPSEFARLQHNAKQAVAEWEASNK